MNFGYFFWGHLGDRLSAETKNTPDGNCWYSSSIIHQMRLVSGNNVWCFGPDRDKSDIELFGKDNVFNSFCSQNRKTAYDSINRVVDWQNADSLPKLDILLLEWRFAIPGRNINVSHAATEYQPDLDIQNALIEHYSKTDTQIYIFDLDYKLSSEDEIQIFDIWTKVRNSHMPIVIETATIPRQLSGKLKHISVDIPFWMKSTEIDCTHSSPYKRLVYVGNRYERDDAINQYIVPISKRHPYSVWFYGNWTKYEDKYMDLQGRLKWREIQYHDRIGHSDFHSAYHDAVACPLLAKPEYFENGFVTARIQECLAFGSIPVGFSCHKDIDRYLPPELIVNSADELDSLIDKLLTDNMYRHSLRHKVWYEYLQKMDVSFFIQKLMESI